MPDVLILDADSIAYKAAAANESRTIITRHKITGELEPWANRTAWRAALKANDKELEVPAVEEDYDVKDVQEARHVSYGKTLVQEMIKGYKGRTGIQKAEIYISGDNNFRDLIPLPAEHTVVNGRWAGSKIAGAYKGKRVDSIRPLQLKELRQWMITELGAIPVHGMEVDDMSAIRAYEGFKAGTKIVQVTEDKDALGCSGWLFNPVKMTRPELIKGFGGLHISSKDDVKGTGRLWFYFQSLYGDPVDCYHGCSLAKVLADKAGKPLTFGEKAAYNILKDCKSDAEAVQAVVDQYRKWYAEPVTYLAHDGIEYTKDAIEIWQMYVDAAHMRRWKDDRVDVVKLMTNLGVK